MSEGNRYNGAQLILAFLGGAAVGAAAALLAAPGSGAETRDHLKRWGKDAQDVAGRVPNALRDAATRAAEAAKEAFHDALEVEETKELERPEPVETA
jgi:gas vesicle protein